MGLDFFGSATVIDVSNIDATAVDDLLVLLDRDTLDWMADLTGFVHLLLDLSLHLSQFLSFEFHLPNPLFHRLQFLVVFVFGCWIDAATGILGVDRVHGGWNGVAEQAG